MRQWWLSSAIFTVWLKTDDDGVIIETAPIAYRWVGRNVVDFIKRCRVDRYEELFIENL
jgi:hypothetical protein